MSRHAPEVEIEPVIEGREWFSAFDVEAHWSTPPMTPEECLLRDEAHDRVHGVLATALTAREARALRLRFTHGLKMDEIGAILGGVGKARIGQIIAKAIRKLQFVPIALKLVDLSEDPDGWMAALRRRRAKEIAAGEALRRHEAEIMGRRMARVLEREREDEEARAKQQAIDAAWRAWIEEGGPRDRERRLKVLEIWLLSFRPAQWEWVEAHRLELERRLTAYEAGRVPL